jgi:signal transduction histidine kinase/CheY-like chemotaxis protein
MAWLDAFFAAGRALAPHGYCLLWDPTLVWTHVVADALIAAAYFSIPLALISFIRRRRDLQFGWIFWLFALFIVACGSTHLMSIWTLWRADYGLEAVIKVVTAIASVGTAIVLWPLIPRLLLIPSPSELRVQNAHLEQTLTRLTHEIAERKRVEDALRQAHKMEAIGQLTGGIAHDFNNLLQSVTGSLALIARHPQSDKVAKWSALGLQAAERGGRLTAQLLAFSRTQKLELRPVAIAPLLAGMEELLESAIGKSITIERAEIAAPEATVLGDPTQIELAVLNLAINARDAMPEGGRLTIRVEPVALDADPELAAGDYVRISVADTGTGMAPDVAARAFDPFFTTKPVGKGTGLGLSMVYGVARQSGGRAEIATAPGRGTTVSMLLKAIPAAAEADAAGMADPAAGRGLRVLVVDDDEDVRLMTASMLEDLGHRPITADSGDAALALLASGPPDLILLDFVMPGMNGAALAAAIRERGITVPILFATGFADTAQLEDALGPDTAVLRKPYDLASLSAAIARARRAPAD